MQIEQSVLIIRQYQDQWGINGLLETLEEMQMCYDDLNHQEAMAFRTFMAMGREFFAPVEKETV
jgi:hypothetical protein